MAVTQTNDSPSKNAAAFSPLITRHQTTFAGVTSDWTFTNGNRTLTHTSGSSGDIMAAASQLLQPGQKYHFEAVTESMHSSEYARFALALVPQSMWASDASPLTGTNDQFEISLIKSGGTGSNTAAFDDSALTAPTNKPTTNSRLTFEVDMSTIGSTTVKYFFNGSLDTTYSSLGFADEPYYVVSFTGVETDRNGVFNFNFGSSDFTDTPTSGHRGLTAKDAFAGSAPTIEDGSGFFNTILYTANNSDGHEISTVGFVPDMVWIKDRDTVASHALFDSVRGVSPSANNFIVPNTTDTENQGGQTNTMVQLGKGADGSTVINGFTLDDDSSDQRVNYGGAHVAWNWLAGGAPTTDNVSNGGSPGQTPTNNSVFRDGVASTTAFGSATIYPTRASINTTSGLSIVEYIGTGSNATIAHGLGAVPKMALFKNRESAGNNWPVYHVGTGNTHHTFLDGNNAKTAGDRFQDTDPTSSVFSVDGTTDINKSTDEHVAYFFAEIPGYSKFGAFSSGGSGDPFVECGFTPALIFLKRVSATDDWYVHDTARDTINSAYKYLVLSTTAVEASNTSVFIDIISNGFVCDLGGIVTTNDDMIFGAWATNPFAGSTPATAR